MPLRTKNEWPAAPASPGRINTRTKPDKTRKPTREDAELALLREKLRAEGEQELLSKIANCGLEQKLICDTCHSKKIVRLTCKRKWCPFCAKRLAARRSTELSFIVERYRWPLFVTLTMRNESQISSALIKRLRRAFGKLRHRKLWRRCTRGGIAAVEITNIGNGWHPHIHAVIDCQWLAWKVPIPSPSMPAAEKRLAFKAAAAELSKVWAKILGQETASVKVKRCNKATIAKEVVKYTVKNEDLVETEDRVGDLIRAIDSTRLMTTFGTAHGQTVRDIRALAKAHYKKAQADFREANTGGNCCPVMELRPLDLYERWNENARALHPHLFCASA